MKGSAFSSINVKSISTILCPLNSAKSSMTNDWKLHIYYLFFFVFQKSFKLNQNKSQKMLDFCVRRTKNTLSNNTIVKYFCVLVVVVPTTTTSNFQQQQQIFFFHSSYFSTLGAVCIIQLYLRSLVNWFSFYAVANSYVLFYYFLCFS